MDFSAYLGGLPLHPFVVHFAVALVPLAALSLILLVAFRSWADKYGWATLIVLALGTGAAFLARESGEDLAAQIGRPAVHAQWGTVLPFVSAALLVLALVWLLLHKADRRADRKRATATVVTGLLTVLLALATTALTIVVGHSGSEAVWTGRTTPTAPVTSATPTPSPTPTSPQASTTPSTTPPASPSASSTAASFTLAEVATHNSASSCWAAISGSVYDLTTWINRHPGGPEVIKALCGTDATSAFTTQHGGEVEPADELEQLRIGTLS
jgi:cytochrome b involved in lipid metabolism